VAPETGPEAPEKRPAREAIRTFLNDARNFVQDELWDRDLSGLSRMKRFFFSLSRVATIVVRGFVADNCALQASALTYITLMSMVPVLALMLSVSKGMGAQEQIMEVVGLRAGAEGEAMTVVAGSWLSELPEQMARFVQQVFSYVGNTNFRTLGAIGLLLLFWSVLKAMGRVEHSFNLIWGVKEARSLPRKFSDYISVLIVVPILILASTSVNTMVSSDKLLASLRELSGPLYWVYVRGIRLSGLGSIMAAFCFLYAFMPNTKVRAFPALMAGIVGGLLWYGAQRVYIEGQVGLTKLNAIYGAFAAIPFFLAWLYASWLLVLFGAEVGFAVQHYTTFRLEGVAAQASASVREMLGLVVAYEACKSFREGNDSWSVTEFGRLNGIPTRLLADVTTVLTERRVLVAVASEDSRLVPTRDLGQLTVADVEEAFRGVNDPYLKGLPKVQGAPVSLVFREHYDAFLKQLAGVSFRDLLEREDPAPAGADGQ